MIKVDRGDHFWEFPDGTFDQMVLHCVTCGKYVSYSQLMSILQHPHAKIVNVANVHPYPIGGNSFRPRCEHFYEYWLKFCGGYICPILSDSKEGIAYRVITMCLVPVEDETDWESWIGRET